MSQKMQKFGVGASALRMEDDSFLRGKGRYTDDISVENCLRGFVVRSPIANGAFKLGSLKEAKAAQGVRLILTAKDVAHLGALQCHDKPKDRIARDIPILCAKEVSHVGDAVAFVVADSLFDAQNAAELIDIDWQPADAIASTAKALDKDAPLAAKSLKSNLAYVQHYGSAAKTARAFAKAAHVTRIAFHNNRLVPNYIETRAAIGEWRADEKRFVLTAGTQGVHSVRKNLADIVFRIPGNQLRVITPDVGGGFGPKGMTYREYALVLEAAKRLSQPVKWVGERGEHFLSDAQGRDNVVEAEMAMDKDGRFLALRATITANLGAYMHQYGAEVPSFCATMATGCYDIGAAAIEVRGIYTNTVPVDAYRGAGRPEAAFMIERLADECARDLGLSPDEIRMRNFVRPEQFPYRTQFGRLYDVGNFAGPMRKAMEVADWAGFKTRLAASKSKGKWRGIGLASYIEACAFEGSEPAFVQLRVDGMVELRIGTQSTGQGHATAYAQFAAEKLNLDILRVEVRQGDTDELARGGGTGGSRSIPLGGVSASRAGEALAQKIKILAADELEAASADIELADGFARIAGTDRQMSFAEVARAAKSPQDVAASGEFEQFEATYPNGTHVCEVEIDPETGATKITGYAIVDDFGVTVNPMLLAGQVHGGVAQGVGQALTEDTVYSEDGQILSASFMDYGMPRADLFPNMHFETLNVPSTTNALGIKGAGEAGSIGATPAVMNAVIDALWRGKGIRHLEMPATPQRVWQAIAAAKAE